MHATKNPVDPLRDGADDWIAGDEPMNAAQRARLRELCAQTHESFDTTLTKAEAASRITQIEATLARGGVPRPDAPRDEGALGSLGRALSEPVVEAARRGPTEMD